MSSQPTAATDVEYVNHGGALLAIIVPASFHSPGIHFFTSDDMPQQVAHMSHRSGKLIVPHVHSNSHRQISQMQEVLVIKNGKLRVDFYDEDDLYLHSRVLSSGDVILLTGGGHGFEVLEDLEMIEIKQGPYLGGQDKRCFEAASKSQIRILNSR